MNADAHVGHKDPHWDLVIEIAAKLWVHGTYTVELVPVPTQRFVDLQWAARQAGRVLGGRSWVHVGQPRGARDGPVTVTVTITHVDPGGVGHRRAEAGLEALMRQVLESQAHT
jgi:hypothetical protein